MQTLSGNAAQNRADNPEGIPAEKYPYRSKPDQAKNSRGGKPANGFLTTVFKPLHAGEFYPEYSEGNYRRMYESVMNYARLLKRELSVKYDPYDWKTLFDSFGKALPGDNEFKLAIDDKEETLKIELWLYDDRYNDQRLYYLPCGIIDRSEGLFREILVSFFRLLRHRQGFNVITESCFFEMMEEQLDEESEEGQESDWAAHFNLYVNGYKKGLFDLISLKPKHSVKALEKMVCGFHPQCRCEANLKPLILEGLELFKKRKKILWYGTCPQEDYDTYTVGIDEVIQISYQADSYQDEYIRYLNETAQESGFEYISAGKMELTPTTKRLLKPDKYVIRFMDWLNRLNDELYYL